MKAKKLRANKLSEAELLQKAMEAHAASGAAWERDFGDRPVVNYDTGDTIAKSAKEYRRKKRR